MEELSQAVHIQFRGPTRQLVLLVEVERAEVKQDHDSSSIEARYRTRRPTTPHPNTGPQWGRNLYALWTNMVEVEYVFLTFETHISPSVSFPLP